MITQYNVLYTFYAIILILNFDVLPTTSYFATQCPRRDTWSVTRRSLHVPELDELANILGSRLNQYFEDVTSEVRPCPDLRRPPYKMANIGMNGNARLVDVGSLSYIVPLVNKSKSYSLTDLISYAELDRAFVFGAGGGPFRTIGYNSEGMFSFNVRSCTLDQHSIASRVDNTTSRGFSAITLNNSDTDISLVGALFAATGLPGNVVKLTLGKRTNHTFELTRGLHDLLDDFYGPARAVGLGVIIVFRQGRARLSIMPDFPNYPILSGFLRWVKYFNVTAPLILMGTIVTHDLGLRLYSPHFHARSDHVDAGHWHYDLTPDESVYEVLLSPGEFVYRVDMPGEH